MTARIGRETKGRQIKGGGIKGRGIKAGEFKGVAFKSIVVVLVIMLLSLQFRLWAGEGSFAHVNGLGQKVEHARAVNVIKEQRNEVLRAEIRDLKSGHDSIEEKARVELGFIKEGETFYMLVENEKP